VLFRSFDGSLTGIGRTTRLRAYPGIRNLVRFSLDVLFQQPRERLVESLVSLQILAESLS
jgi:hypothetical protein